MGSALIGFILAIVIFFSSVALSLQNFGAIIDFKSILIVVGGTFSVSIVCFPMKKILQLFGIFLKNVIGMRKMDYLQLISDIGELSKANAKGKNQFEAKAKTVNHPFLGEGAEILFWSESDISDEELRDLLETRAVTFFETYNGQANMFKTLSKFPPAFGLLGTTLGMIGLLQSLGDESSIDNLGPSMAVALITTLYGLAMANFIFIPISVNLAKHTQDDFLARKIIVEGLMLIQDNKPTRYVEEKLKSFLLPNQRDGKE